MNAETMKNQISVLDALHQYGMKPNSRGFMLCPFHNEKTPSFKVYADGTRWKCFGCNRGGSVIDLVMELFSVDFKQATDRICIDFGLTATDQKADRLSFPPGKSNAKKSNRSFSDTVLSTWRMYTHTGRPMKP